jgi:hypothetical protein
VDKYREFYFKPISNDIQFGLFEGKQYQEPDVESDFDDLVNAVNIYRANEDDTNTNFVLQEIDNDSVDIYGLKEKDLMISDYVDTNTAAKIAQAIVNRFKEPLIKQEVSELKVEDDPFPIGFYALNNRLTQYVYEISDFEDLYSWTLNVSNTTIQESTEKVVTKKRSFDCLTTNGSKDEFIEFDIDDPIYFPNKLIIYILQDTPGQFISIRLFDEDGNFEDVGVTTITVEEDLFRVTQGGDFRVTLGGDSRITQQKALISTTVSDFPINIVDDFVRIELDILTLNNVAKVRIIFITDEVVNIFLDTLQIQAKTWRQNILISEEFNYLLAQANFKVGATFGEKTVNIIDDIKKLDDKSENILNIFEKDI